MSKKPHNVGLKLSNMNISLDNTVIRKPLPKNKKLWPGLKKGSGQLADGGPVGASGGGGAAEGLQFAAELLNLVEEAPALQNITSERPVQAGGADDSSSFQPDAEPGAEPGQSTDGELTDELGTDGTERYVKNAHLIKKTAVDAGQFEELWIYSIDPDTVEPAETPLKAILAGTDIPENSTQSEDGTQSYSLWTAGNAQYVHIKGLPN